jgi:hypothetical protein
MVKDIIDPEGYISIWRRLKDNPMWLSEKFTRGQAWVDLIMLANHKPNYYYLRGNKVTVQRGQVARSADNLATRWGWGKGKVQRFINELEIEQQIKLEKSNIINKITIVNYDNYQKTSCRQTNRRATDEPQTGTNNNDNNENKKESIEKAKVKFSHLDLPELYDSMIDWHKTKGKRIKDYPATFRNWCRLHIKFGKENKPNQPAKKKTIQDLTPEERAHYGY